jgi:hypothetical protein
MTVFASMLLLLVAATLPGRVAAQPHVSADPPQLVRCGVAAEAACLRAQVTLTPQQARLLARDTAGATAWSVRLGDIALTGVDARPLPGIQPPLRLLVLVDISGSMAGDGMSMTRAALRSFLAGLPDDGVSIAVAPFDSRRVVERVREAQFGDRAAALAQLEHLPPPAGNTGLYSAIRAGIDRLEAERAVAAASVSDALLVITDGRNDVGRRGDDPDLLSGVPGREAAMESIRRSGIHTWIIGMGGAVDDEELGALASAGGEHYIVALDPYRLAMVLSAVGRSARTRWEIVAVVPPWARSLLARGGTVWTGNHRVTGEPDAAPARAALWRPPYMAPPAFTGTVTAPSVNDVATATFGFGAVSPVRRNLAIAAVYAALLLALWFGLPPLLRPAAPVHAAATRTAPPEPAAARPADAGGTQVLAAVGEAPPRKMQDVTVAAARRVLRK